jgi:uncharacterized protein YodC (DUF2158 family)
VATEFTIGDKVHFLDGGPVMRVGYYIRDTGGLGDLVTCYWIKCTVSSSSGTHFDFNSMDFPPALLELVTEPAPESPTG